MTEIKPHFRGSQCRHSSLIFTLHILDSLTGYCDQCYILDIDIEVLIVILRC
jgi:hypothetical protein